MSKLNCEFKFTTVQLPNARAVLVNTAFLEDNIAAVRIARKLYMNDSDPINEDIVQFLCLFWNVVYDVEIPSDRQQTLPKQ